MPRAVALRETSLHKAPPPADTPWYEIVYALPGAQFYVDPSSPPVGAYLPVQVTTGNFQMNAIDTADVIQQAQTIPRAQLQRQGRFVVLPGATSISARRRNAPIVPGRMFWALAADLRFIDDRPKPPPSVWLAAPIAIVALGGAGALTKLAVR